MKRWKKTGTAILSVIIVLALFFALQRLVMPKYDGSEDMPLEGNFTAEYYEETTSHDVLMVGDCEVYENFDPMYLWKHFGITSYIRGNAQQLVWQSYYMLEDALKYEKPKVVIYNVQSLTHGSPQREEYNRMTLDGMKWSQTKIDAIQASMCKEEKMADYVLPVLRYHSRITGLKKGDLTYYFKNRHITHNGYYMRIDVLPLSQSDVADGSWLFGTASEKEKAEKDDEIYDPWADIDDAESEAEDSEIDDPWAGIDNTESEAEDSEISDPWAGIDTEGDEIFESGEKTTGTKKKDRTFSAYAMKYLDKLRNLCKKQGIGLILIKAPSLAPQWYEEENRQVVDYAEKYELPYINFYELLDETGIDFETDTYDGGLHMNLSGADKLSEYLGNVLKNQYGMKDHRKDHTLSKVYEEKLNFYEDMKTAQKEELEKYGEIKSY